MVIEIKCGSEVLPYLKGRYQQTRERQKVRIYWLRSSDNIGCKKKLSLKYRVYWLCSDRDSLQKNITLVPAAHLEGISLSYKLIDKEVATMANRLNLELFAWTVDDPDEAKRLIALGIKGITTNNPGWLREKVY